MTWPRGATYAITIAFTCLLATILFSGCNTISEPTPSDKTEHVASEVWMPDLGNGMYKNPIIFADYSDPDVVRVGEDYYMTASSFNCVPGLPILHSKDLVNWTIVNHALPHQKPLDVFDTPQHGNGVWAPAIRYHLGEFYIYYGDPDFGIYMTKTADPLGEWSEPHLVQAGKGWIDPCPFWDDNGKAYLVHAWAGSRAGIKSVLTVHEMSPDGKRLLDHGVMVFDGHKEHRTVEGSKFYKRNGYYYIFAPAGGVPTGWQLVMRSKDILGPYEEKIVLHRGNTDINGPHQGAWVTTPSGEDWFIHFQDREAYGRVVHLQPVQWKEGWPMMGIDQNGDGIGEPVSEFKKPDAGIEYPARAPQSSDEFNEPTLGLQWQWHANPTAYFGTPSGRLGFYRLNAIPKPDNYVNFWQVPNLFLQKFTAEEFTATTKIEFFPNHSGERTGLLIMGESYTYLCLLWKDGQLFLEQTVCVNARQGGSETVVSSIPVSGTAFFLRAMVTENAQCTFYYSTDNDTFLQVGTAFTAAPGRWIGAKVGLFALSEEVANDYGYTNVDWFRIHK